jgi:hypothetical protein
MRKFEVQEFNLCGGWANNWTYEQEDGTSYPSVFNSREDAEKELDWFLAECENEVYSGNMEDSPDREDFRIVELEECIS